MLSTDLLQFLYELSQNNNKDWFERNKPRYEAVVKKPFEATVAAIIERISVFDPAYAALTPKDCIFRIYRDVRFSKDKTPYKNHISASFSPKGKKMDTGGDYSGFYLHIEFGSLMLGGGAYFLDKPALHKVRTAIMREPDTFRDLLAAPDFVAKYGELQGERNKVLPPEFKEAAQREPLLAMKQYYFMAEMDPEIITQPDFVDFAAGYFRAGQGVNAWLREAVGSKPG